MREIIRQFTPNWFTVTMGTGVLALALNQFPLSIPGLHLLAEALWWLNIGLFIIFAVLYGARWILFPHEARRIFGHSVVSMFFGAIPMGLATIINGFVAFGVTHWGTHAIAVAYVLWWLDMAMAVGCGVLIPFLMFTRQNHSIEAMTAVWLIPIVAAEVTAASAGVLLPHLAGEQALRMLVMGYALWAFSVPLAMSMLVILVLRLVLHKLPHRDMAASGWLALGPLGTGALGLLLLGQAAPPVFRGSRAAAGRCGRGGAGADRRDRALGLWCLVASAGRADHGALPARRHAVQHRLVGLHLPTRGLFPCHASPRATVARWLPCRGRRGPGAGPGAVLVDRDQPNADGSLAALAIRRAVPDLRCRPV